MFNIVTKSPLSCVQIRAKEAQKIEAEMTRNPEDTKRRAMLERLPELTRVARTYLLTLCHALHACYYS